MVKNIHIFKLIFFIYLNLFPALLNKDTCCSKRRQLTISIGWDKQFLCAKRCIIFLSISFNICFGCSKESSHRDGSFEYPQHMFWLRIKNIIFLLHVLILETCLRNMHIKVLVEQSMFDKTYTAHLFETDSRKESVIFHIIFFNKHICCGHSKLNGSFALPQ